MSIEIVHFQVYYKYTDISYLLHKVTLQIYLNFT